MPAQLFMDVVNIRNVDLQKTHNKCKRQAYEIIKEGGAK
jgi:hypothetical protein